MSLQQQPSFNDISKVAPQPVLKDAPWIVISFAVWIASFVFFAQWSKGVDFSENFETIINVMIASTLVAIIWGFAWLFVIRKLHNSIVKISLVACPLLLAGLGVWSLSQGGDPVAFFVLAVLSALWGFFKRDRIPFVTAVLSSASTCLVQLPGLMVIQIVSVILNVGWGIFYLFMAIFGIVYLTDNKEDDINHYTNLIIIIWLLYTMCSAINQLTAHVIVCGTVAAWWLTPNDLSPIGASASRACRYSFGSISLGAFLITIMEAIQIAIGTWLDNPCTYRCWACFQDMIKLYSSYCFVRVAVFNESFCESAKATNQLFKSSGLDAVTNDTFIWAVLYLGSWIMGALHGLVTTVIWAGMYSTAVYDSTTYLYAVWLLGTWIGRNMCIACLMPIDSTVRTTYVLWTEASATMLANRPDQMKPIIDAHQASRFYTPPAGTVPMQQTNGQMV
jgi:hypothetical protein